MKILMHMCCSNCSIHPLQSFLLKGMDIKGLWFNPNIHPYTEYSSRLESVQKLQKLWGLDIEYFDTYALDDFLKNVVGRGEKRCEFCYYARLEKTAETAKKMNLPLFTTSLLASPYQKFDIIVQTGKEIGRKFGLEFYSGDFRNGWPLARNVVRELGLYRQKYCGCVYSEMERYRGKKKP